MRPIGSPWIQGERTNIAVFFEQRSSRLVGAVVALGMDTDLSCFRDGNAMQTLIDPFELHAMYVPPPARAPMATLSIDIDFDLEKARPRAASTDDAPDSWGRIRCWCSED
jgi:hypothetical protein